MANMRFGANLIGGLANPSYQQGMFNLGSAIGSAPAVAAAKKERDRRIAQMQQFDLTTPEGLAQQARYFASIGEPEKAREAAVASSNLRRQLRETEITEEDRAKMLLQDPAYLAMLEVGQQPNFDINTPQGKAAVAAKGREMKASAQTINAAIQALRNPTQGSGPAPKIETLLNPETNKYEAYVISFNPDGTFKEKTLLGEPAPESGSGPGGIEGFTGAELSFLEPINVGIREARQTRDSVKALIAEDARIGGSQGLLGDAQKATQRLFGIIGDEAAFRTSLQNLQIQAAIKALPKGPASDKDVELVMSGSQNFADMDPETRRRYLQGLATIQEAIVQDNLRRLRYIDRTRDVTATGYEHWVEAQAANNEALKLYNAPETNAVIQTVEDILTRAANLEPDDPTRQELIAFIEQERQLKPEVNSYLTNVEAYANNMRIYNESLRARGINPDSFQL